MSDVIEEIMAQLAEPFAADEVKSKPAVVSGSRALALFYIDARCVMDRLDDVVGVANWQDVYDVLPDGNVVCKLSLRIAGEWIAKMDVGGPSEQPDEGDQRKAAFSDALKRVAVKWGIGRYLYRIPHQWVDYDAQKKKFAKTPTLPDWALPGKKASAPKQKTTATKTDKSLPADGKALLTTLSDYDANLAKSGACQRGDLLKYVEKAGVNAGYEPDIGAWSGEAIALAAEETKAFAALCKRKRQGGGDADEAPLATQGASS